MTDIQYEIHDVPDPEGGLILELHVEGERVATARAALDVLTQMGVELGSERAGVHEFLRETLVRISSGSSRRSS